MTDRQHVTFQVQETLALISRFSRVLTPCLTGTCTIQFLTVNCGTLQINNVTFEASCHSDQQRVMAKML